MAKVVPPTRSEPSRGEELVLGSIVGVFGVHGELRIFLHNRASELLFEGHQVDLVSPDGARRSVWMSARPGAGDRVIALIPELDNREEARSWIGWEIRVPRAVLPEPEPGEYYVADLVGMQVFTASGQDLGHITEVHQSGAVDVWVAEKDGEERFIPALQENVLSVDPQARTVRVHDRCALTS